MNTSCIPPPRKPPGPAPPWVVSRGSGLFESLLCVASTMTSQSNYVTMLGRESITVAPPTEPPPRTPHNHPQPLPLSAVRVEPGPQDLVKDNCSFYATSSFQKEEIWSLFKVLISALDPVF
jgi:hypothetical protein